MATWRKLLSYRGSWPLPPAEGLSGAVAVGWTSTALKRDLALQPWQPEGMREKRRLEWPSFSSGAGGSWYRWKNSAQEAFSLQGELRTVEGVETSSS